MLLTLFFINVININAIHYQNKYQHQRYLHYHCLLLLLLTLSLLIIHFKSLVFC